MTDGGHERAADAGVIGVFTMGGTIASTPGTGNTAMPDAVHHGAWHGVTPRLSARDLVAAVPELAVFPLQLVDVRRKPSPSLTFADLDELLSAIADRPGLTGIVVTQGTDTIEETSWLLDLRYHGVAPVVVTGAMRTPGTAGADGPANLLAATQVASSPDAHDLGVLVVLNDEIHTARTVRKAHSTSTAAFASPDTGPIGRVIEGTVTIFNRPARACRSLGDFRPMGSHRARVAIVPMTLGEDDTVLRAIGGHVDGLVVAGFGAGNAPTPVVEALTELAWQKPVVLTTRTAAGPVTTSTYGYPGSGSDLLARGLISAGYLGPYKARILLHVLLTGGAQDAQIKRVFSELGSAPLSATRRVVP